MATTLSTAEPNAVEVDDGLIYFRCPGDGWIAAADDGGLELPKKLRMGYQPLDEYGRFGNSTYYVEHPFEPLFQAGGAREMPVAQVIANGFHLHPPLVPMCGKHVGMDRRDHLRHRPECWKRAKPVVFPQLEGVDVPGEQTCPYCKREDIPSPAALDQHVKVMHSDRKDQEAIVAGITAGLKGVLGNQAAGGNQLETLAALLKNPDALAVLRALGQPDKPEAPSRTKHSMSPEARARLAERNRQRYTARKAAIQPSPASPAEE